MYQKVKPFLAKTYHGGRNLSRGEKSLITKAYAALYGEKRPGGEMTGWNLGRVSPANRAKLRIDAPGTFQQFPELRQAKAAGLRYVAWPGRRDDVVRLEKGAITSYDREAERRREYVPLPRNWEKMGWARKMGWLKKHGVGQPGTAATVALGTGERGGGDRKLGDRGALVQAIGEAAAAARDSGAQRIEKWKQEKRRRRRSCDICGNPLEEIQGFLDCPECGQFEPIKLSERPDSLDDKSDLELAHGIFVYRFDK